MTLQDRIRKLRKLIQYTRWINRNLMEVVNVLEEEEKSPYFSNKSDCTRALTTANGHCAILKARLEELVASNSEMKN